MKLPSYLADGTPAQQSALKCLTDIKIFDFLSAFDPALAGTIPLDIQVANSDLDILFEAANLDGFAEQVDTLYGHYEGYSYKQTYIRERLSCVITFTAHNWPIELFAQDQPVAQQFAFRHMQIEARILSLATPHMKDHIIQLKQKGLKTEPAFAHLLALKGDPYIALLALEDQSDGELLALIPPFYHPSSSIF